MPENDPTKDPMIQPRSRIDALNETILRLLVMRDRIVMDEIVPLKLELGLPAEDLERRKLMMDKVVAQAAELGVDGDLANTIFDALHDHSVAKQREVLGP